MTTRTMGGLNLNLTREIDGEVAEIETLLKTTAASKHFPDQNRKTLNKKCKALAALVRVYIGDEKKNLTQTQIADLQIFEKNINALGSRLLVEKTAETLVPVVQALRVEFDDLFN